MRKALWRTLPITLALSLSLAISLQAQQTPAVPMPRTADPDWEVTSVKPSDPNSQRGQHINMSGHHIMLLDTTVEEFLLLGYGVQKVQLLNLPDWAKTQRWDAEGPPDIAGIPDWPQLQSMMRKLLAERFGLTLHHEQRELSVYTLTVVKGAAKVTPNTSNPNGWMDQQNGDRNGQHFERLKNVSMQEFSLILQFHVDRPVVDQTKLPGRYDLQLKWQKDDAHTDNPDAPPGLFTAIQEQAGLKLNPTKAPADVLVIDKIERPEAN